MTRAIRLSVANGRSGRGGPFAALVVKDDRIIAEGTNLVTSKNDPTAHAEIVAIRKACRVLSHHQLLGCEIYSTCEPCPMCMAAIYWARPSRVYYANTRRDAARIGFDDLFIDHQLQRPRARQKIPLIRLRIEGALQAFQEWSESKNRVEY